MTSREDLLDQYIDARNQGNAGDMEALDDPELRDLFETIDQVRAEAGIEWPETDFPARMSNALQEQLTETSAAPPEPVGALAGDNDPVKAFPAGQAANAADDDNQQGGWRWYSRQFAGMAAAGIVVGLFALGLAYILGDWGGEVQAPGAIVEPGQIPGTILYAEFGGKYLDADADQLIARIDADGTNQQNLAMRPSTTANRSGIAWSPDGQWVAYFDPQDSIRDARAIIRLVSSDGSESEALDMEPVAGVLRINTSLNWSHDGSSLAFIHRDEETERNRVGIVHRQTGELESIGYDPDGPLPNDLHPAWAPDEWALAFARNEGAGRYSINILYGGMSEPVQIVEDQPRAIQPDWSPDGDALVWVGPSEDGERANVHVVDIDSGEIANITGHGERFDYVPTWSRRDQIAFMSDFGDMNYDIFVVNPDGSDLTNITEDYDWRVHMPDWSDDGRYLTFTSMNQDQDRWRINVYDMDEDRLYTVHESENPLFHAQWRPDVEDSPDFPDDADVDVSDVSDEQLDLMRQSAELFLTDDDAPVLTVNGEAVTATAIESRQSTSRLNRMTMQEFIDDNDQFPELTEYNEAFIALIDEYGVENVGLGVALMRAAVQVYAEENGLVASDAQVDDAVDRQRESYQMIEDHDPEMSAAVGLALIDAIGEDRYWNEYLPRIIADDITESNVDEAVWSEAEIDPEDPDTFLMRRDLYLAEFRADLLRDAEIEVVEDPLPGGAELDRAIEYITEGYPGLQERQLERRLELREGGSSNQAMNRVIDSISQPTAAPTRGKVDTASNEGKG